MKTNDQLKAELENAINTSDTMLAWNPDPKGYFTIKPFPKLKRVFVRHYDTRNNLTDTLKGTSTAQIIQEIIKRKLISRLDHSAYLGKEIEKAIIALQNNLDYVQDKDLAALIKNGRQ